MKKSIHAMSAAILSLALSNAWAADPGTADKPGMGTMDKGGMQKGGMPNGEMKGMNMDKEHMEKMHEHMDEMHKSNHMGNTKGMSDAMKGDGKCDMKSDGKCDAKDMKSMGNPTTDKPKAPVKADKAKDASTKDADDHAVHH